VSTCTDKVKNGKETDVDCGGGTCPKCEDNKSCTKASHCLSGICTSNTCQKGCVHQSVVKDCKTDSTLGLTFCTIPSGCFKMGSPKTDTCRFADEPEQIPVTLSNKFEMQSTEVTQAQFEKRMKYKPSYFASCGGTCPVEQINWHEAAAYCNALSAEKGLKASECYDCKGLKEKVICTEKTAGKGIYTCKGYRLPTEAEWEYAYRGGTIWAYYIGPNNLSYCDECHKKEPNADSIGWFCHNAKVTYSGCYNISSYAPPNCAGTHPVKGKPANPWGLYDMAGNAWEWCHDGYQSTIGATSVTDPVYSGSSRVLRGGAWSRRTRNLRGARRFSSSPTLKGTYQAFGFRCVITR